MLGFLQGFSYGLFLTSTVWLVMGVIRPALGDPVMPPRRWAVVVRYAFVTPSIAVLLWLTSLWGGFSPSLGGWLAGLVAIAVEVPLERRWRGWWARRRKSLDTLKRNAETARRQASERQEAGVQTLDPEHPPADADELVLSLCRAKQALLEVDRQDHAPQADRLYSRYCHVIGVLGSRFEVGELAYERARGLVTQVCLGAIDNLTAMAHQASGISGVDAAYVRRRLTRDADQLTIEERIALKRRLALVEDTEHQLRQLAARNEAALTALDDAAVAVARLRTDKPQASLAADQACAELKRFVEGAERYDRNH
ncbi:cobyrinic acid a,c-diamide synthase [Onishia niordana]|uniref:cobyrinic acid a,c-diamide synthase n=1 Tax=Onishia niordana TaxID=2508711 RepID=UPI0010A04524|nr:cobyrinic acid a,c-diamide synthase [Halomonas niordiana]